jgi:hypothetical protein
VAALLVVVPDVVGQEPVQLHPIEYHHLIQQLPADRTHSAFGHAVLPGHPGGSLHRLDPQVGRTAGTSEPCLSVPIAEHVAGALCGREKPPAVAARATGPPNGQ